jgi:hypothetical protein
VNGPHIEPPRERKQSLLPANSTGGDASLSTNPILHGGQEVDNQTQDPNDRDVIKDDFGGKLPSARPPASTFTPRTQFYLRTGFYRPPTR